MFVAIKRKIIFAILESSFYRWFLTYIFPFIRFSMYYTDFDGDDFYKAAKILIPGDVILTVDKRKASSIIPGKWDHAALYIGGHMLIEATHKGVCVNWFFNLCKESDQILILRARPGLRTKHYIRMVIKKALFFVGKKYDVGFKLGVRSLYCSEVVALAHYRLKLDYSDLLGLGRPYISPTGLLASPDLKEVFVSRETPRVSSKGHAGIKRRTRAPKPIHGSFLFTAKSRAGYSNQ